MQRSAKKMRMGCTLAYCPFAFIFVSGSRCAPYHKKFTRNYFLEEAVRCGASQKKPSRDSTLSTALDGLIFWDVPQIAAYHKKLMNEMLKRFHNITRVKNNSFGLGKNVEEEHIGR